MCGGNDVIDLHLLQLWRAGLAGEHANVFDDVDHTLHLIDDARKAIAQRVRIKLPVPIHADQGVFRQPADPGKRLVEFMGDPGGHLTKRAQAI